MVQEHGQRAPLTMNQSTNQPMFQCGSVFSHGPFGGIDFCWGEWDPISEIPSIWAEEFHLFDHKTRMDWSSWRHRMRHFLCIDCTLLMHVFLFFDFYQPLQHNSCATSCDVVSTFSIQSIGEFKLEINDVVSSSWFWSNRPCLWCSSLGPRWIKCKNIRDTDSTTHSQTNHESTWKYTIYNNINQSQSISIRK